MILVYVLTKLLGDLAGKHGTECAAGGLPRHVPTIDDLGRPQRTRTTSLEIEGTYADP